MNTKELNTEELIWEVIIPLMEQYNLKVSAEMVYYYLADHMLYGYEHMSNSMDQEAKGA